MWEFIMKSKTKKIISIMLAVAIVATLCVTLAGCGEKTQTFKMDTGNDKASNNQTFTLEKGTTYYINFSDNTDGRHTIRLSANKNVDATIQYRYPYKDNSWKTVQTVGVTKNAKDYTANVYSYTNYPMYNTIQARMNQEYRLVVKPNAKTKLSVGWSRFVQKIDTDFENGKSYAWTPSTTPKQNAFQVKSIFYLSKNEAKVMGALLRDQNFINNLKTLDGKKNIPQSVFDKMTSVIKKAVDTYLKNNKNISKFNSENFATMACECFGELISYSIGLCNLNAQMKSASETLLKATSPMKLTFSQGSSDQPSKNMYSLVVNKLSARKVTINNDVHYVYSLSVPACYAGTFKPYATTKK